jgi:hypothetical protein
MEKNELTLSTPYEFYCERLKDAKNKLTVEEVFSKILECDIRINLAMDKNMAVKKKEEPPKESQQNPLLDDALEIMGGKVVE